MKPLILAIDQGTTGTTALLFDKDLNIHGKSTVEFKQYFPQPSWVEHDLNEIWQSVIESCKRVLSESGKRTSDIAGIGITNQRETTCLWYANDTAQPVGRAIVWQDRRTVSHCERLKKRGLEKAIRQKTGLLLDPYFSATKLSWFLKQNPLLLNQAKQRKVLFGTIDSYLLYRMTGVHATDVSNASRTLLMDIKKCEWDRDLLQLFRVPRAMLPEIRPSMVEYGRTKKFLDLPDGTPVCAMAGDQQAALFGQACFEPGSAKCTYGTGAFIIANTGTKPVYSRSGLLTTIAWKRGDTVTYGLEGSSFIAGAAVSWLRELTLISNSSEVESVAKTVPDSDEVVFVPALSGMGAPHWLPEARGMFLGLTRRTTRGHLARAVLEGIALQITDLLSAMAKDGSKKLSSLKVDGGASQNELLMQFQADVLGIKVVRSKILETTALGAGLQAGLALGIWKDEREIQALWKSEKEWVPTFNTNKRKEFLHRWNRAIRTLCAYAS